MKELYIAPEWKIVCFAPMQQLANTDPYDIQAILELTPGVGGEAGTSGAGGDLDWEIP